MGMQDPLLERLCGQLRAQRTAAQHNRSLQAAQAAETQMARDSLATTQQHITKQAAMLLANTAAWNSSILVLQRRDAALQASFLAAPVWRFG